MSTPKQILVSGGFDDIRARDLRFLEESAKLGELTVALWSDALVEKITGRPPKFPLAERHYFLNAVRYVSRVGVAQTEATLVAGHGQFDRLADTEGAQGELLKQAAADNGLAYRRFSPDELSGFPEPPPMPSAPGRKKVIATGCYDWFHSGHVRFCEEASTYGDLYICLGSDANVRLLKGAGHPLLSESERRYVVGSIKYVKQALITTGSGWLDADPEIRRLRPDIYIVNEDGDKGGKREYCEKMGLQYFVLKRTPAPGLPKRSSTGLRGF